MVRRAEQRHPTPTTSLRLPGVCASLLGTVDPDPGEEANAELNALILDLATSLAQREGSKLHIVHAWRMPYESALRSGRTYLPQFEVDRSAHLPLLLDDS